MEVVIESSLWRLRQLIRSIKSKWNVGDLKVLEMLWVSNILDQPHRFIDFVDDRGVHWKLIFPTEGVMFIIDYMRHMDLLSGYAGGAVGDGDKVSDKEDNAAVLVFPKDTDEIIELRIIHEYLHSIDLPADDLDRHAQEFLSRWMMWYYRLLRKLGRMPEHMPLFQRAYYRFLLEHPLVSLSG